MTARTGIIGAGVMGSDHARILHDSITGATVTAVADPVQDRARAVARKTGARTFSSAKELIASPFVDAVLVRPTTACMQNRSSSAWSTVSQSSAKNPWHPPSGNAWTSSTARTPSPAAIRSFSGFMRRFHPAYRELKDLLEEGAIGQPLMVLSSPRNVTSYPDGNSASTITNSGIHGIDVTALAAQLTHRIGALARPRSTALDSSRQDPQILHLRAADGVLTSIDICCGMPSTATTCAAR